MRQTTRGRFWWCVATREAGHWHVELGPWEGAAGAGKDLHWSVSSRARVREELLTIAAQRRIPTEALRISWRSPGKAGPEMKEIV